VNPVEEMDAKVKWLTNELLQYCGPIFVAPTLDSFPEQMLGNGTYALIDTGQKHLLVTCYHVWETYQKYHDANDATVLAVALGEGDSCIAFKNPEKHRLAFDRDLDLVVFEFEPQDINIRHTKSWFKILAWPIPKAESGAAITTLGFAGAWRTALGTECRLGCAAIPFVVTDTSDRSFAVFCDGNNRDVLEDIKDVLGGFSGSPAYCLSETGELRLVGFAKLGPLEGSVATEYRSTPGSALSAAVFFTHASFLAGDGTLHL
jgi:hypothetical protein